MKLSEVAYTIHDDGVWIRCKQHDCGWEHNAGFFASVEDLSRIFGKHLSETHGLQAAPELQRGDMKTYTVIVEDEGHYKISGDYFTKDGYGHLTISAVNDKGHARTVAVFSRWTGIYEEIEG